MNSSKNFKKRKKKKKEKRKQNITRHIEVKNNLTIARVGGGVGGGGDSGKRGLQELL